MNPEQQQIAIAKAHGRVQRPDGSWFPIGKDYGSAGIPNYPFDLNAMHEVEKVLWDTGKAMEFTNRLVGIVCLARGFRWDKGTEDDHLMCLSHATASQRAEAFLRTIGKWEEAK